MKIEPRGELEKHVA